MIALSINSNDPGLVVAMKHKVAHPIRLHLSDAEKEVIMTIMVRADNAFHGYLQEVANGT